MKSTELKTGTNRKRAGRTYQIGLAMAIALLVLPRATIAAPGSSCGGATNIPLGNYESGTFNISGFANTSGPCTGATKTAWYRVTNPSASDPAVVQVYTDNGNSGYNPIIGIYDSPVDSCTSLIERVCVSDGPGWEVGWESTQRPYAFQVVPPGRTYWIAVHVPTGNTAAYMYINFEIHHDLVMDPVNPVRITIPKGKSSATKKVKLKVANRSKVTIDTTLYGEYTSFPPQCEIFSFNPATCFTNLSILPGKKKACTYEVTVSSADVHTPLKNSPRRCMLFFEAYLNASHFDGTGENAWVFVPVDVLDLNDQ